MATNEKLSSFIDSFNNGYESFSAIRPLSSDVDYVEFVEDTDFDKENFDKSVNWYSAYLIKLKNKYVGIIQDGGKDLHIYVKEDFRKKSNLITHLNDVIIPYILRKKDKQIVTFVNEKVEEYFLNNLKGIKSTGLMEAEIVRLDKPRLDLPEDKERKSRIVKIDAEIYKIKNNFRELINKATNKKAMKYLIGEDFISKGEYAFLTPEEKKNYSLEDFLKDREIVNPIIKKKSFCCAATYLYAGEEAEKKLRKFIKEL